MVGIQVKFECDSSWLSESGYSIETQAQMYDDMLQDMYNNPGWYLDHFRMMREVRVSWGNYKQPSITKPYKFSKKGGIEDKKA